MNTLRLITSHRNKARHLTYKIDFALSDKDYGLAEVITNHYYALIHKINLVMENWR